MRLGVLGGAFNPPHIGHLVCAQEALLELELDHVLLIPTGKAPHREIDPEPGPEVRLDLAERAVAGDERLSVSRIEIDRDGPSYTVDTLRQLGEERPDDELVLILGGDQAAALPRWKEPEEVLTLATVAAVPRTGWSRDEIVVKAATAKGSERMMFFDMPRLDVSSTLVRHRVALGKPIRYLVPDGVADAIVKLQLYRAGAELAAD